MKDEPTPSDKPRAIARWPLGPRGPLGPIWLLVILCVGAAGAVLLVWALLAWMFGDFHLTPN